MNGSIVFDRGLVVHRDSVKLPPGSHPPPDALWDLVSQGFEPGPEHDHVWVAGDLTYARALRHVRAQNDSDLHAVRGTLDRRLPSVRLGLRALDGLSPNTQALDDELQTIAVRNIAAVLAARPPTGELAKSTTMADSGTVAHGLAPVAAKGAVPTDGQGTMVAVLPTMPRHEGPPVQVEAMSPRATPTNTGPAMVKGHFSNAELERIDAVRGSESRGLWLRRVVLEAVGRRRQLGAAPAIPGKPTGVNFRAASRDVEAIDAACGSMSRNAYIRAAALAALTV